MSNTKQIRILNVISSFNINGGLERYVYNLLKNLNPKIFKVDVLAFNWNTNEDTCNKYIELFEKSGIRTYSVYNPNKNFYRFMSEVKIFMKNHNYDIVHVHTSSLAWFFLYEALINNVKCRIFHAHETRLSDKTLHRLRNAVFFPFTKLFATEYIAVSNDVAKAIFKNTNVSIIYASIEHEKFKFNKTYRDVWRRKLKLNDSYFIVGLIGRFCRAKNIKFALRVLRKISKKESKIKLIICGDGPQKKMYKRLINKWKLQDRVLFIKPLPNVHELYSAFDCLIMPSKYEGLGLVAVEAQFNGLKTVVSKHIPREADVGNCVFLPLSKSAWVKEISKIKKDNNRNFCFDYSRFTNKNCTNRISSLYKTCYDKTNML